MQRKGKVGRIGEKFVSIRLDDDGSLRLKKGAFPSLKEDMRVTVSIGIEKDKVQKPPSAEHVEVRRQVRWVAREYDRMRKAGKQPDYRTLRRRAHLQLVENEHD